MANIVYRYKTVGLAPGLYAEMNENSIEASQNYLEKVLNHYSKQGWEFYRVDHLRVSQKSGCFGIWLGTKSYFFDQPVTIFRRPVDLSAQLRKQQFSDDDMPPL